MTNIKQTIRPKSKLQFFKCPGRAGHLIKSFRKAFWMLKPLKQCLENDKTYSTTTWSYGGMDLTTWDNLKVFFLFFFRCNQWVLIKSVIGSNGHFHNLYSTAENPRAMKNKRRRWKQRKKKLSWGKMRYDNWNYSLLCCYFGRSSFPRFNCIENHQITTCNIYIQPGWWNLTFPNMYPPVPRSLKQN